MNDDPRPLCTVVATRIAKREGRGFLNEVQYEHVKELEKRLAFFNRAEEVADLRIERIGTDLYELKDKGGPLGRINLRVYFGVIPEDGEIVILKTYKKEEDRQIPRHILITVEDRFEDYKHGALAHGNSVYKHTDMEGDV
jgi:hypothetical protein